MADFSKSLLIPARAISSVEEKMVRDSLSSRLLDLLLKSGKIVNLGDGVVREALPNTDFALAAQDFITGALVINTEATYINVALAANKYLGIYFVANLVAAPVITVIHFRTGAGGASTKASVMPQKLWAEMEPVGYLTQPIIYVPNETVFIRVVPNAASAGERLFIGALVAEPRGETVSF